MIDPACGSGSLLLKAAKILGKENVRQGFYGQEINLTTYNLCRINMFLHDIDFDKFNIAHEDTLINPQHWDDEPFEVIVSNPPYSIKWEGDDNPTLINDPRFSPAGVLAPKSKADMAFIMHSLSWLATDGTASIVCFPGIMYRGGAEKKIRQYLIDNNFIDCIIQLPSNLFYGTSIATCIMVLKKSKPDVVMIFDECHRSQFGDMHIKIIKKFKKYNIFGFTGTPIFAVNSGSSKNPELKTTGQAFGEKLHTYTIVNAINDGNVLHLLCKVFLFQLTDLL